MNATESETSTSYSLVQVTATEWIQFWISCLQLTTKFVSSRSSCSLTVLVNSQRTQ